MMGNYDLIIVGGGPAGLTLARLATARNLRILLLEPRRLDQEAMPGSQLKSCGGLLAPDAQKCMAELGLGLPASVLTGPQLFSVRTIDLEAQLERQYQRFYINLDRERFDRWLASLLPPAVDQRYGVRFRKAMVEADGVQVRAVDAEGREVIARGRFLVGADGATSTVRRQLFPGRMPARSYIAIQEWFAETSAAAFTAVFDPRLTDFYGWTIPKGNRLLAGIALAPGPEAQHRFVQFKLGLRSWGFRLDHPVAREGAMVVRPVCPSDLCLGDGRVILVGEAAGWISPSSAEGFSYAFESAMAAFRALDGPEAGLAARYRRETRGLRLNLVGKWLKSPAMYQPWLRRSILASGLNSLEPACESGKGLT